MYTIPYPPKKNIDDHVSALKPKIQASIKKYHPSHSHELLGTYVENKMLKLDIKVEAGSLTEWFLDWLLDDNNLEQLLTGRMSELLNIIQMVENERVKRAVDQKFVYQKISEGVYQEVCKKGAALKVYTCDTIDVFNEILHRIFVDEGYSYTKTSKGVTVPFFDKSNHVRSCGLRICPYCGRSFIYAVDDGTGEVKPQIDHFIPKRKYPYLALSYFNLIPVCSTCNMASCKGNFDPMSTAGKLPFRIGYPYDFRDSDFSFKLGLHSSHYFDDSNFDVRIDFKCNAILEAGSNQAFKLSEFYKHHNHEAANIYRQIMVLKSRASAYYASFGLPKVAFSPSPKLILGFGFDERSSRTEILYKLKKDIYLQVAK